MKRHILTLLACLVVGAMSPLFAQDVTITNARIIVANGTVIERGSIVVRGGQNCFRRGGRAVGREWPDHRCEGHDRNAGIH